MRRKACTIREVTGLMERPYHHGLSVWLITVVTQCLEKHINGRHLLGTSNISWDERAWLRFWVSIAPGTCSKHSPSSWTPSHSLLLILEVWTGKQHVNLEVTQLPLWGAFKASISASSWYFWPYLPSQPAHTPCALSHPDRGRAFCLLVCFKTMNLDMNVLEAGTMAHDSYPTPALITDSGFMSKS